MKSIKNIALILMISSIVTPLFAMLSDDPGLNILGTTAIGGALGGRKGAYAGLGVGVMSSAIRSGAQSRSRDDSSYDYRGGNYNRGYNSNSRSSMRQYIQNLENENNQLRNDNYNLMRQLQEIQNSGYSQRLRQ